MYSKGEQVLSWHLAETAMDNSGSSRSERLLLLRHLLLAQRLCFVLDEIFSAC